ncbi:MFS transporter [Cellulomonas xylanilytica]|uniref:MFS transporter n=1 Tax=Cellulomonas xylanilytica TaxID=233583 RepID=A0A510V925_9CELL|nr:MFS transporter [Cellulomonas xylanilytica]GEK21760.1 MFS transporter [Cellulomonas xylanilytica]
MTLGSEYRRIWAGNASSNLADGITFVALPLLAATLTQSPLAIAGLAVAYAAPRALSVLGIGVLIDRVDRRRLLYLANFSRAALFAALAALVLTGATPLAVLYLVYAVLGVVETLSDSAAFAVLPQAVRPRGLDRANSQVAATQTVVDEFVGPPLGGLLFAAAAFAPSALTAAAYLLAGFAFWRLRGTYVVPRVEGAGPSDGVLRAIREGAVWTWRHRVVRLLVVVGALASVAYMIPFSYLVLYAQDELGLGPTGYGLLLSFSALGGLLGAAVASRLRRRIGYGATIVSALCVGALAFAVLSMTTNLVVVAVALAAYIAHAVVWNIMAASVRQKATPASMMGRVGSVSRLLGLVGLAVGAVVGGLLASAFGYLVPFAVAGGLFAVAAALCVVQRGWFAAWEQSEEQPESP